jgi:transcriptional regulator with XRE-family HTH domain
VTEDPRRALAEFLRTRRTRMRPQDVGLEPGLRRRVAGLRHEELALLAGVSSDYYQRMEQGRDVRPSDQVLDAIARALNFSAEESRHLLAMLLHPDADQTCPERAATVAELTGMLRAQVAAEPGHPTRGGTGG